MMTTQDNTATFPVPALHAADILRYASALLPPQDRSSEQVTDLAAPLMEWARRASSREDLRRRMWAMERAFVNDQARLEAARKSADAPRRLTSAEFLAETGTYCAFMEAAA